MRSGASPLRIEATVTSLAPGGDGVAHVELGGERRAVFLRNSAPGDRVLAEIDPSQRPARGRVLEIVTPGPERVIPACPWTARCGGCDWMHLSVNAQATAHAAQVRAALPTGARDVAIAVHTAADAALGYRSRARLHMRSDRGRLVVGMNEARTHDPVEVESCAVLEPGLEQARRSLARWFAGSSGRGEAGIALGAGRRPVLDVRWRGEVAAAVFGRLELAVNAGELAGARVTGAGASRPATIGDPESWIVAGDGLPLRLGPGGFGQANDVVNGLLARHVAEIARAASVDTAVELYAGAGNLSVVLRPFVGALVTVEESSESCDAARANLAARGLSARVVQGDAEAYAWGAATGLLVLDPPRTGARAVARRLAEARGAARVRRVVYVSCDTPTLARDLAELATTYAVRSVATFEMFPQTSHVETVVALERRRGPPTGAESHEPEGVRR